MTSIKPTPFHNKSKSEPFTGGLGFQIPPGLKIIFPNAQDSKRRNQLPETPHEIQTPRSQFNFGSPNSPHPGRSAFNRSKGEQGFNSQSQFSQTFRQKAEGEDGNDKLNSFNRKKQSDGFGSSRSYLKSPRGNHLSIGKSSTHSKNFFGNSSEQNLNEDEKVSNKMVRQLKEAIKRTKHNELEDQLNLEEQKELENKIKKDLLPQISKMKDQKQGAQDISLQGQETRFSHKVEASKDDISVELFMIIRFLQNRAEYLQTLKMVNKEKSIEIMVDLLRLSIELDDMDVFIDSMDMLAQTALMFSDFKLSIIVLNMMKTTCDMSQNSAKKIPLFRMFALVCKKLGLYEEALRFLKKALQYIWLEDDKDSEIQIYDDLGLIFFHMVQLEQAKNCHEKSVQSFNEPIDNVLREMSSRNLIKFKVKFSPPQKTIEQQLIHKLLQFPLYFVKREPEDGPVEAHVENGYMKKNNLRLAKNISNMSSQSFEAFLITQILQSNEFIDEITMPLSKPKDISSLDFIRMKKVNDHFVYVEERELKKGKSQPKFVILLRQIIKQTTSLNEGTFYLQDEQKKMDLSEKIKLRIKQFNQEILKKDKIPLPQEQKKKETFDTINMGHLTTNRSVEAFTQAVSINYASPNKFYDKIISGQYHKHHQILLSQNKNIFKEKII